MGYYALISSLPMLTLDGDSGMTMKYFLSSCESSLPEKKYNILEKLELIPDPTEIESCSFTERYGAWENALRNAIVRVRANKLDRDPADYLKEKDSFELDAERAVAAAWAVTNPLERERILDQARWNKIEELAGGDTFSFEQLCAYKLKLILQRKWIERAADRAARNLDLSTGNVLNSIEQNMKQEN